MLISEIEPRRMLWFTVPKAANRSKSLMAEDCPADLAAFRASVTGDNGAILVKA